MLCPKCGRDCGDKLQLCDDCQALRALHEPPPAASRQHVEPAAAESVAQDYADASQYDYAGFWLRVCSSLLDSAIVSLFTSVLLQLTLQLVSWRLDWILAYFTPRFDARNVFLAIALGYVGALFAAMVVLFIASILYFILFECSSFQATPGKMITGTVVTRLNGERVSFLRATGRYFGKIISMLLFGVGFLMPAFTAHRQTLHDMMAGCVVRKRVERPLFFHVGALILGLLVLVLGELLQPAPLRKERGITRTETIYFDGTTGKYFGPTTPPKSPIRTEPSSEPTIAPTPEPTPVPTPEVLGSFSGPHARVRSSTGSFDAQAVVAFYYPDNNSVAIGFYPKAISAAELDLLKRRGVLSKANDSNRPLMTFNLNFSRSGSVSESELTSYTAYFYQDAMSGFTFASASDAVSFSKDRPRLSTEDIWEISGTVTPGGKLSITTRGRVTKGASSSLNFRWDIADEVVVFGRN